MGVIVALGAAAVLPTTVVGSIHHRHAGISARAGGIPQAACGKLPNATQCYAEPTCEWNPATLQCDPLCVLAANETTCAARACQWDQQSLTCQTPCGRISSQSHCNALAACAWSGSTQRCGAACARLATYTACIEDNACTWSIDSCVRSCQGHATPDACVAGGCTWELSPVARCAARRTPPTPSNGGCPDGVVVGVCENIVNASTGVHLCQFYQYQCLPRCDAAATGNECLANPACTLVHGSKCVQRCAARHNTEFGCNADIGCGWNAAADGGMCTEQCQSTAAPGCEAADADCATVVIPDIGVTCQKRCRAYPTPQLCATGNGTAGGCAWNATSGMCAPL